MKKLYLIHGDKGGIGKSFVAQMTAAVWLKNEKPLTLIDGDVKNPGLHRYFHNKPHPVLQLNATKSSGIDLLLETFLSSVHDVLVDMPAGGSEATAGFVGVGTDAGSVDIADLMEEAEGRLVIIFVMDQSRDSVVALEAELSVLPPDSVDWVIVRNTRLPRPFDFLETWPGRERIANIPMIDMPPIDPAIVTLLVKEKKHFGEIETISAATALNKLRTRKALDKWQAALKKAGLMNG